MEKILRYNGAVKRDSAVDLWLDAQAPALGALGRTWYAKVRGCGSDVRELMHDGLATACVKDAPFAYVGIFKAHVNVGFFHGAALNDPAGLLEGSGKRMRHVKLRPGENLNEKALNALIAAAYADIKARRKAEE